jgi:hypothetical protein
MNLVLVELLVTPCSPRPGTHVHAAARSFKHCSPVLVDFVGRSASCIPFFHHTRTPQRACISLLHPHCCPSYTRSLTCHNLLFRHIPFSRQPSPPLDTRTRNLRHLDDTSPLPIWTILCLLSRRIPPHWDPPSSRHCCCSCPARPTLHGEHTCFFQPPRCLCACITVPLRKSKLEQI